MKATIGCKCREREEVLAMIDVHRRRRRLATSSNGIVDKLRVIDVRAHSAAEPIAHEIFVKAQSTVSKTNCMASCRISANSVAVA